MRDIRKWISACLLLLTACSQACFGAGSSEDSFAPALHMDRAFAGPCVFGPSTTPRAAILAAIIPSLLNVSLDRLGKALTDAGQAKTITRTAVTNVEMSSSAGDRPACILFISGDFLTGARASTASTSLSVGSWISDTDQALIVSALNKRGIYLAAHPEMLFEGRLRWSSDNSAAAIEVNAIQYSRHFSYSILDHLKSERDIVVSIAFSEPGSDGNKGAGTLASVKFEKMNPAALTYRFSVGPASETSLPSTGWIPVNLSAKSAPRTILVSIAEANDGNQFLSYLGDVLSGSKAQLQTEAENLLIPEKREAAQKLQREAASAADLAAKQLLTAAKADEVAARNAIDDMNAAAATYNADKNSGRATDAKPVRSAAGSAISKMLAANHSALSAGIAEPFGDSDIKTADAFVRTGR